MSDLVFKVKAEIGDALMRGDDPARAAIKAIAEWGQNNFYDDKPLEEFLGELLAQLKEGSE